MRVWIRALGIALGALVGLAALAGTASAAPAAVVIDTTTPQASTEDDGSQKLSLGFTNLTDQPVTVRFAVAAASGAGCSLSPTSADLNRAEHAEPEITATGCESPITFTAQATTRDGKELTSFPVTTKAADPVEKPDWKKLWRGYLIGILLSTFVAVIAYSRWKWFREKGKKKLFDTLPEFDATWSFQDNWVTNITALGAIFGGIFATLNVAETFLGTGAKAATTLLVVSAPIGLLLAGIAPIVLLVFKRYREEDGVRRDEFTIFGILAAAAIVLASAFGQLVVTGLVVKDFEMGGFQDVLSLAVLPVIVLLLAYALRNLNDILIRGTEEAPKASPKASLDAVMMAEAIWVSSSLTKEEIDQRIRAIGGTARPSKDDGTGGEAPAAEPVPVIRELIEASDATEPGDYESRPRSPLL